MKNKNFKSQSSWNSVFWTEESKINWYPSSRKKNEWRWLGTNYNLKYTSHVKYVEAVR